MKKSFLTRLHNNEALFGSIISLPSPAIAEIFAMAGFDWLLVDLEHSTLTPSDAQAILQAVAGRAACILRVPLNDEIWIKKALDTGATGVMIPQVNSLEDAQQAVRYCKYPPQGTRSVGIARAQGFGAHFSEYLTTANSETCVIIQIEHIQAVDSIEEILKADGLDAVLVGPYDLSASMNMAGQMEQPAVQTALERIRVACLERSMPFGIFTTNEESVKSYLSSGYRLIALSGDIILLTQAASSAVQTLRKEGQKL